MGRARTRNPSHRQEIQISLDDIRAAISAIEPLVEEHLEQIAQHVAENARQRVNRSKKKVDVKRNLDFWPDSMHLHKHLQDSIVVKESKYPMGGWLVKAMRPHAHLVEYGHYLVTPEGKTIGFVPPHPFLRPARDEVAAGLGRMEL